MKTSRQIRLVVFLTLGSVAILPLSAQTGVELPSRNIIGKAVAAVETSVVQIETIGGKDEVAGIRVTDQPRTGTVVSSDGYIVTAAINLAHEPPTVIVRLSDGQRLLAEIVAHNHARKISLLRVTPEQPLVAPKFVDRSQVQVGQTSIAVGRSMDLKQTNVSTGIISAVNRIWGKAIQTDAGISPHNFGGPLIDLEGNVLGILVPMSPQGSGPADGTQWYDSGIGFAVPVAELRLADMMRGEDLHAGMLGVSFKEELGYASRPLISASPGNSPAALGGLKPGDEIIKIDGEKIDRVAQVRHVLGPRYAGERIKVEFVRKDKESQTGEALQTEIELVGEIMPWRHSMIGVIPESAAEPAKVKFVIPGGPADAAGVKPDDIIINIAGQEIYIIDTTRTEQGDIEDKLMTLDIGSPVKLVVERQGKRQELELTLAELSAEPISVSGDAGINPRELVEIKVAEHANVCHGYFPQSSVPTGLLLWITEPGKIDPKNILEQWQEWCDESQVALLIPQSQDVKKWTQPEIEFLNKAVSQIRREFDIDPFRIAVGGQATGGVMASLVAMSERATWRGLILVDTGASKSIASVQSEPGYRQMVLMLEERAGAKTQAPVKASFENFQKQGFAVHYETAKSLPQKTIVQWVQSLNRF